MKVCAVTTLPPHRDGVALYSDELYSHLAPLVTLNFVANISSQQKQPKQQHCKSGTVVNCWKRGLLYPLQIFRSVTKTRCHLVHIQHGWFLYGNFVSSLLFPVLLAFFCLTRKPVVVTMHTVIRKDAKIYDNRFVNYLARLAVLWLSRCIIHFSDKVIVHNSWMKKVLQTEYQAKGEKIVIIPHGTKEATKKANSSKKTGDLCFLSLGFLRKEKGINSLLEAFKEVLEKFPTTKLVIVGGTHVHDKTSCSEDFKKWVSQTLQTKVFFTGFVDDNTLEQLLWESDLIVLSSTDAYYVEASGALAAVADYGKPVVCSKVPKFQSELENGEDCLLVAPSDSMELAQTLLLLAQNSELRKRLGVNLKEKFKNRRWGAVAKKHFELYKRLLGAKT